MDRPLNETEKMFNARPCANIVNRTNSRIIIRVNRGTQVFQASHVNQMSRVRHRVARYERMQSAFPRHRALQPRQQRSSLKKNSPMRQPRTSFPFQGSGRCVDAINGTIIIRGSVPLRNSLTFKTADDRGTRSTECLIGGDLRATAPSTPANELLIINVQQIVSSRSRQFIAYSTQI